MFLILCFHLDTLYYSKTCNSFLNSKDRVLSLVFQIYLLGKWGWGKLHNYLRTCVWFYKSSVFSTDHSWSHAFLNFVYLASKTTHSWFPSYFSLLCRIFLIFPTFTCGMPSGLTPWPSSVYTHNLGDLTQLHSIKYHLHADNTQFISTVLILPLNWISSCPLDAFI